MNPAGLEILQLVARAAIVFVLFSLAVWILQRVRELDRRDRLGRMLREIAAGIRSDEGRALRILRDRLRASQEAHGRNGVARWRLQHARALRRRGLIPRSFNVRRRDGLRELRLLQLRGPQRDKLPEISAERAIALVLGGDHELP